MCVSLSLTLFHSLHFDSDRQRSQARLGSCDGTTVRHDRLVWTSPGVLLVGVVLGRRRRAAIGETGGKGAGRRGDGPEGRGGGQVLGKFE